VGVNPVVAVALGAAIYAHMLETGHSMKAISRVPTSDIAQEPCPPEARPSSSAPLPSAASPLSLPAAHAPPTSIAASIGTSVPTVHFITAHGVGVKARVGDGWVNKVLIGKNTRVPYRVTKRFLTKALGPGRQIRIEIMQGDTMNVALAEQLGTGTIRGLPPNEPDGQPVDVTMEFDAQGRLHILAMYVPRNQQMEMALEIPGGLRPEEVIDHRRYLQQSGFFQPPSAQQMLASLDSDATQDDDDDDLEMLEIIE